MVVSQWKFVEKSEETDILAAGGAFLFAGAQDPSRSELEILRRVEDRWQVFNIPLPRCTYGRMIQQRWHPLGVYHATGILADNPRRPDRPAWFAVPESRRCERSSCRFFLSDLARSADFNLFELVQAFCTADNRRRARAYLQIVQHHGAKKFDCSPREFTDPQCVENRYRNRPYVGHSVI